MNIVNPIGELNLDYLKKIVAVAENLWTKYVKPDWPATVHFFLTFIEAGARELDNSGLLNEDKKATLLEAAGKLYDDMVAGMLPIYLRPFNSYIKRFLVNVVLNVFVDYLVGKIHQIEQLQTQTSKEIK